MKKILSLMCIGLVGKLAIVDPATLWAGQPDRHVQSGITDWNHDQLRSDGYRAKEVKAKRVLSPTAEKMHEPRARQLAFQSLRNKHEDLAAGWSTVGRSAKTVQYVAFDSVSSNRMRAAETSVRRWLPQITQ